MERKYILLILLPIIQVFLHVSCCGEEKPYFDVVALKIYPINEKGEIDGSTVISDTLQLALNHQIEAIAGKKNSDFSFIASAYATSCPDGYEGIKYLVEAINIYSQEEYFSAGKQKENINHIVRCKLPMIYGDDRWYNLQECVAFLGRDKYHISLDGLKIYITQKSNLRSEHTFIVEMDRTNGETLKAKTETIIWH